MTALVQQEALTRATNSKSMTNYHAIFEGFIKKGIPAEDILPRENVFTYAAWQALGKVVKKGEHGVKVITWVPTTRTITDKKTGEKVAKDSKYPRTSTVFHVSQTQPIA